MERQPLGWCQAALDRFGLETIHLTQHLQHILALGPESWRPLLRTVFFREPCTRQSESLRRSLASARCARAHHTSEWGLATPPPGASAHPRDFRRRAAAR